MAGHPAITTMRAILLVGLVAYFAGSLGWSLVREQQAQGLMLAPGTGSDPGIRVLLLDRPATAPPTPAHDKLVVDVLEPSLVVSPDEPDNQEHVFPINGGEQLVFRPDVDGIMISSPAREERWLVSRLRIQPRVTTLEPPAEGAEPESPAKLVPTRFEGADGRPVFMLGSRRYRGSLEVYYKNPKELVAINHLPMEAYVEGVVAVEMGSSWPLEALRAQAIASRSYAYATRLRVRGKSPYDVDDTVGFQEYRGYGFANDLVSRAARSTAGVVLAVNGQPFTALFHASSGGWTESIDAVLPNATALYGAPLSGVMPAQEDPWCRQAAESLGYLSSHWQSATVLKRPDIRTKLNAWLRLHGDSRTAGYVSALEVGQRDPVSKRVATVIIRSIGGSPPIELPAHVFRMIVGPKEVRSTLWSDDSPHTVDSSEDRRKDYRIVCYGYGHGVGMSQISAWAMAKDGRSYKEILAFFYPGSELRTW